MTVIGEKIRAARKYLGMSQDELAEKMGYSGKTSISKIENGVADIPLSKVSEFAKALHTTPAYLLGWEGEEKAIAHYIDDEAAEIAQTLHDREDLRMMFDAARDVSPEDLQIVAGLLDRLKKQGGDGNA